MPVLTSAVVCTHPLFEKVPLVQGQAVCFCDHGNDIDDIRKLLHDQGVDRAKAVSRPSQVRGQISIQSACLGVRAHSRVDEEEAAVDAGVGDVALAHGGQLLSQVSAVLVLDVFDDRVPAAQKGGRSASPPLQTERGAHSPVLVVDLVAVARSVDDVEAQLDAILNDDCQRGRSVNLPAHP